MLHRFKEKTRKFNLENNTLTHTHTHPYHFHDINTKFHAATWDVLC